MKALRLRFLALLLPAAAAFAGAGETGFDFLTEPAGARASAMGGTSVAATDDAEASLFNPAALAELRQPELSLGYASYMEGLSQGSLAYGHPLTKGVLGISLRTLRSATIKSYDASDNRTGTYDAQDSVFSAGYGRAMGDRRWGGDLKQVKESIAGHGASVTAADFGATFRGSGWPVSLSAALRNVGGRASFGQEKTDLPRSLDLGGSALLFSRALLVTAEARRGADGVTTLAAGAEAWLYNALALRGGWQGGDRAGNGLSLGMGFKLKNLRVDYSFAANGQGFSPTHRMSLSLRFGGPGEKAYQDGLRLLQGGRTAEAVLKFQEALDADPGHTAAIRALRESVKQLQGEMREDEAPSGDKR
jgi:hypothetical protein